MPRPRDPDRRRLTSSKFRDGYAVLIGGIWYLRHGLAKRSTGLRDAKGNDARVVKMLDAWIESRLFPTPTAPLELAVSRVVGDLHAEFCEARHFSAGLQRTYDAMLAAVFPVEVPLSYDALALHLARRKGELLAGIGTPHGLALSTIVQYLKCASAMLRFAVERGELPRNPMTAVGIPPTPKRDGVDVFSGEELAGIVGRLAGERDRLLVAFLAVTAARSIEALRLTPDHITDTALRIDGKGARGRAVRVRYIPLNPLGLDPAASPATPLEQWYHDLWAVLAELRRMGAVDTSDGPRYFPDAYSTYLSRFRAAALAAGIDDGRRLHTLRATAEERWEAVGFDPFTITDQAGHSLPVYLARYRAKRTVERTAERIRITAGRLAGGSGPASIGGTE